MATFSVNQVRQLYVAKELKASNVAATDAAGSIAVKSDTAKNHMYFEYKGADNLMRSDLIDIKNILDIRATDADKMAHKLKSVIVTLDSTVNAGELVVGQNYILRLAFRQYVGMSDEDQYLKYGMVLAYKGMTTSDFYKKLALSLAKNFSREIVPLITVSLKTATDSTAVESSTKESDLTGTYTGVIITEAEQPWRLGVMAQTPVYFEVQFVPITASGEELLWGTLEDNDNTKTIDNGKKIADLEYFCMGERGDMYRKIGFPNDIPTTYLVDPNTKYSVIDIHYAYVGNGESVQKSEKTITLVVPKANDNTLANSIITAINTATGLNIASL